MSPNELEAEELVGHEFNDADDRAQAVVEMTRLGAQRGDHDRVRRLLRAGAREGHTDALPGPGAGAVGALGRRLGRCVPRRLCCGPVRGQAPVDCLRFGVACGAESTQHFGAGIIDPARVERLLGEVEAERLELAAEIG